MNGELTSALVRTFLARGVAACGSLVLVIVLGRLYGAGGVGVFALAESLLVAIGTLSRYGMDNALMRFVGRDLRSPHVFAYLRYACVKAFLLSTAGAIALFFSRGLWAHAFDAPALSSVLVGIAVAAPAFTLAFVFSGFIKAVRKPATSCLLQKGVIALLTAVIVVLLQANAPPEAGLANIGIAYALAAWTLLGFSVVVCARWFNQAHDAVPERLERSAIRNFNSSSSSFFAVNLAQFMISVVGIWIAGYFLTSSELGLFKAAQQVALLIGFVLTVINAIFPPRFASLFHDRDWSGLDDLARRSALVGLLLAGIPAVVCLGAPAWVLSLVGDDFAGATTTLRILAAAQLIHVGCGSVGFLLNMSGQERLVRNYAWITNILGLVAILILTPVLNVQGVALGVAIAIVVQNLTGVFFAWRKLGIWIIPMPNLLRMAGVQVCDSSDAARRADATLTAAGRHNR